MYQAPNLHRIFRQTNNSQQGQDVVATPRTTTLIYTPRVQAETDVDDLKMDGDLGEGEDQVGKLNFLWDCTFSEWMGGVYFTSFTK